MSSIHGDVLELKNLDSELKQLRKRVRDLNTQKISCEKRILEYLEVNDQPGLRMNGTVIVTQTKQKRKYQKVSDKMERGINVLQKYGLCDSNVINEIVEAMRGSPETKASLKMY